MTRLAELAASMPRTTIPDHLQHHVAPVESFTPGELAAIAAHEKRIAGIPDCFDVLDADSLDAASWEYGHAATDDHSRERFHYLDTWRESIYVAHNDRESHAPASLPFARWKAAELIRWHTAREHLLTAIAGQCLGRDKATNSRYVYPWLLGNHLYELTPSPRRLTLKGPDRCPRTT